MFEIPSTGPFRFRLGFATAIFGALLTAASPSEAQMPGGGKKGNKGKIEQAIPQTPDAEDSTEGALPSRPTTSSGDERTGDIVKRMAIGKTVFSALARVKGSDAQDARDRGMIPTGLTPKFDPNVHCRGIDDYWAQDYAELRGRDAMHGGIDIPAPIGAPLLAIAAGEVISKYEWGAQGIQIWLRHRPEDTGLPVWTFSQFAHLLELPDLSIGQRVRMGDVIGKTSNTGISGAEARSGGPSPTMKMSRARRPAVHFAVIYNESGKYYLHNEQIVVPLDGWWMDPNAIYRKVGPYDSVSMKALPASEKAVAIPHMLADGTTVPADTKLIWPYACSVTPLPATPRNKPR